MKKKIEPFVSVVTPFYNTEDYLAECCESVLAQTYSNWEYVLVNNCSTDRSAEIAQRYCTIDKRIRLVHNKKFLTQVQNYNYALRQVSPESKYCKIVQADDWIFPECLDKMVAVGEAHPSVGLVSSYRLQGRGVGNVGLPYADKVLTGKEVCRRQLIEGLNLFGSPTSILIRSEVIRCMEPFYNEKVWFEDVIACYEVMRNWNFGFVHQVEMFERTDNESICSRARRNDPDWLLTRLIVFRECAGNYLDPEEFEENFQKVKDLYFHFLAQNLFKGRAFWDYHKEGLATIGCNLSFSNKVKYVAWYAFNFICNPKKGVGHFLRSLKLCG